MEASRIGREFKVDERLDWSLAFGVLLKGKSGDEPRVLFEWLKPYFCIQISF